MNNNDTLDTKDKKSLSWVKWMIEDVKIYKEMLSNEQMGELFFAVMETAETDVRITVSPDIKFPYLQLCAYVDNSKAAYIATCEQNAKNGSKGGKAKAEKNKKDTNSYKPPTLTSFRNTVKYLRKQCDEINCDNHEIDELFKKLEKNKWCFLNKKINTDSMLEAIIYVEFNEENKMLYIVLKTIISKNEDFDIEMLKDFYAYYDDKSFLIDDKKYTSLNEAVEAYFKED